MPANRKREFLSHIEQNIDVKTLEEIADELGITKQTVNHYTKTYGINKRIKTMKDAMREIRRLRMLVPHETLTTVS
jgi:predicted transcriptional regulator